MTLCGREVLYDLVHAIIVGGVGTYMDKGGSAQAVLRMWASSIEECTGLILNLNRCIATVKRLLARYGGTTTTTDQLVREVTAGGVRGGRPTALSVIAEMVKSGDAWYMHDEYGHGNVEQPVKEDGVRIRNPEGLSQHEIACLYGQLKLCGSECYFVRGVKGFVVSHFSSCMTPVTRLAVEPLVGRVVPMLGAPGGALYPPLTISRIIKGMQTLAVLNDAVRGRYRSVSQQVAEVAERPN